MVAAIPNDPRTSGVFQPMRFEADVDDCVVTKGEVPRELVGGLYRSGPSWKRPTKQGCLGWWTQDGMIQALIFRGDGRVDFKNRWIKTPKYLLEEKHGRGLFEWTDGFEDYRSFGFGEVARDEINRGVPPGTSWVNAFPFAGNVVVSGEQSGPPMDIDPWTLETKGVVSWSPELSEGLIKRACFGDGSFSAHPKWDHETGELYGWNFKDKKPYLTLHWVRPDGSVRNREIWDAPYNGNLHDMWLTPEYVILPFQPLTMSMDRALNGKCIYEWKPELPTVLALIRRDDFDGEILWLKAEFETQYMMHTMSANQSGSQITLDAPLYDRWPMVMDSDRPNNGHLSVQSHATNGRWIIDLKKKSVRSERVDDKTVEFPKVDERFYGKGYRYGFLLAGDNFLSLNTIVKRDVISGAEEIYHMDNGKEPVAVLEPSFAPRSPDAPEADGYLIVPVSRYTENRSQFLIFDTSGISQGPVAQIDLPFQMGWTPHGHWMDFRS